MKSELFPLLPDITFAEKDPDVITSQLITLYEACSERKLARADPVRLFIDAIVLLLVHERSLIDRAAKRNLLAYADGKFLEHLGAFYGVYRLDAASSSCMMKFSLPQALAYNAVIPAGVRVSAAGFTFATTMALSIPKGSLSGIVDAICTSPGSASNGLAAGQVNMLADVLTFDVKAENITETSGGTDAESDEALRERIQLAPESFSVAGPAKAYEFFARSADPDIIAVSVVTPPETQPGHVDIYPLMAGGTLPDDATLQKVYDICSDSRLRPDTDYVRVLRAATVNYSLDVTFYIDAAKSSGSDIIKASCIEAANEWIAWQKMALGRDINPSELIKELVNAGAKRCEVRSPSFTVLKDSQLAVCSGINVEYGGLEKA